MELPPVIPTLSAAEMRDLRYAKSLLEYPGLAARLAGALGRPIEMGFAMLPERAMGLIHKAAKAALVKALSVAVSTMGANRPRRASERFHKLLVGTSGGVGGLFGLASLPVELPLSTAIMLRSIADIARSEGHDVTSPFVRVNCLEVFALGGRSSADDAVESSYWMVRAALGKAVSEASTYLAKKGVIEEAAPAILRLVTAIASRFGVVVSEQAAAKAVPLVGAAGGAMINVLFMNHFQDMARGHFIVKRLEARYGIETVRGLYVNHGGPRMIRRDYILRMVQELAQILRRAVSLKERQEYEQALRELGRALDQLENTRAGDQNAPSLEHWLALCEKETATRGPLLVAVGDLLNEQGELLHLQNKIPESQRSQAMALGLYIEAILGGHTFVSLELLDRIEQIIGRVSGPSLPGAVLQRLLGYFEARGQFAKAEDVLFNWLASDAAAAATEGIAFYDRLAAKSDEELNRGGLPRAEVEQGRRDLQRQSRPSPGTFP